MSENLQLPGSPHQYPTGMGSARFLELSPEKSADPTAIDAALRELQASPICLLGSDRTPPLVWLLAVQAFPAARRLYFSQDNGQWQDLALATEQKGEATTESVAPADRTPTPASPAPEAARQNPSPGSLHALLDKDLIGKSFVLAAWGADKPENRRQLDEIAEEAWNRAPRNSGLPDIVDEARRNGEHACELAAELLRRLDREGDASAGDWIASVTADVHERIRGHLQITLKRWRERRQSLQQRHGGQRVYTSSLPPVSLIDGHHPNSLRHLRPAAAWQVCIDETGSLFDEQADALNGTDSKLGRLVALAVPEGACLPALDKGFHATGAPALQVDQVLQSLLQAPVGIFGFTVQDPAAHTRHWIGHVQQLVRWVLLQLPLEPEQPCRVDVRIEQNAGYQIRDSLRALSETLEGEFRRLDPQRFAGLRLSLAFMDKQHPLNGYVDALAFTWGSPAAESRDRLKKSALPGHCLLRPSDRAMERLYLALNAAYRLPPADWYDLCAGAADEPDGGLMARFLDQLGEQVREQPAVWQGYLDEVRQRLRLKQFHLDSLGHALAWLERWAPAGQVLPAAQRLPLETARLAAENHRGQVNGGRILGCLQLARGLREEAPAEACEAILRLAVSTANNFEFAALRPAVEQWLAEPVAVPGLLNHAKLHSTLGQLCAFSGQPLEALGHFDRALECFARLSDPSQAGREAAQTRSYRLIAAMDAPGADPQPLLDALCEHLGAQLDKHEAEAISRSLAHSGQAARYAHHLWLRALATFPAQTAAARAAYLEQAHQWQGGDDHPWPLIEAYRGWLLRDADQPRLAAERLQTAIAACSAEGNGLTLQWMAEVLRTLASALGLGETEPPSPGARELLRQSLLHAPHAALERFANAGRLEHGAIHDALRQCLPFNFH